MRFLMPVEELILQEILNFLSCSDKFQFMSDLIKVVFC